MKVTYDAYKETTNKVYVIKRTRFWIFTFTRIVEINTSYEKRILGLEEENLEFLKEELNNFTNEKINDYFY